MFQSFFKNWRKSSAVKGGRNEQIQGNFKKLPKKLVDLDDSYRMLIRELGKR